MHDGDARLLRAVVAGQRRCTLQPHQRPPVAPAQELDVAELTAGRRGERRSAVVADRQRLVQRRGAFLVAAARGVHERAAQGDARPGSQCAIAGGIGLDDGPPQALQPGIERAGADRRLSRLDLRDRRGAADRGARGRRGRAGAQGRVEGRTRPHAEFALEQFAAGSGLARRADAVASRGQAPHKQCLVVLVQRVLAHEAAGQIGRFAGRAGGHPGQRGLAQNRLPARLEMAALGREPDVERRAGRETHPFEQFAVQARHAQRLCPRPPGHDGDVDVVGGCQRQVEHIATQVRAAEQAPQFAQVPAQRRQRILGVLEQKLRQVLAARAPVAADEVREQPPHLVAARRRYRAPGRARPVARRGGGSLGPRGADPSSVAAMRRCHQASAVVGSMIAATWATLLAGKPARRACSRTRSSLVAV